MKSIFYLLFISLAFTGSAQFQFDNIIEKDNCREGEKIEYCRPHKVMNYFKQHSPLLKKHLQEQDVLQQIEDSLKSQSPTRVVYKIPVVFHVLHIGGQENIEKCNYQIIKIDKIN